MSTILTYDPWWMVMYDVEAMAPRPSATSVSDRDEFDVVVVGSGLAGYTTAILAHDHGASVLMLEAADGAGGTTYKSGAGLWVPDNHLMRERGIRDDRDQVIDYMAQLGHPQDYDPEAERLGLTQHAWDLIVAFHDHAALAVRALADVGVDWMEYPAFHPEKYEAMVSYHYELDRGYGRHIGPRRHDGHAEFGPELIRQLAVAAEARGIELRTGSRVDGLVHDEAGAVVGVTVESEHGPRTVLARQGVVFGTGGFLHDRELCDEHFRGPLYGGCSVSTTRGDFVRIAEELGVPLDGMANGWLTEMPLEQALENRELENHIGMPPGDSTLMVNGHGVRVVNEKSMYHERTMAHWEQDDEGGFPNLFLFVIYDEFLARHPEPWVHRWPDSRPEASWVISGDTLEELAQNIAARVEGLSDRIGGYRVQPSFGAELARTVERFNAMARTGEDTDFHRGESPTAYDWTGPGHPDNDTGNKTLYPLSPEGPYHCFIVCGGVLDTNGGPRANARAQVVDADDRPVPGLYGVGNCVASAAADAYWSGGSTLGPAAAFGYIAAQQVTAEVRRDLAPVRAARALI